MIRNEIATLNGRKLEWLFSSVSRCVFKQNGAWMKSHKLGNCVLSPVCGNRRVVSPVCLVACFHKLVAGIVGKSQSMQARNFNCVGEWAC